MGKPKKSSNSGPRKAHGSKKKMFHAYSKGVRLMMASLGILKKECSPEAMAQSVAAKSPSLAKKK